MERILLILFQFEDIEQPHIGIGDPARQGCRKWHYVLTNARFRVQRDSRLTSSAPMTQIQ